MTLYKLFTSLVTILCLLGCHPASRPARTVAPPNPQPPLMTLGLCEDYPEESRSLEAARRDLDRARDLGAKVIRVGIGWDSVEPSPDQFDWSFWDAYITSASERGVRVIPYVCYTPKWASSAPDAKDFWRHPPRDNADFARFMTAAATRYRGQVTSWEIWNEPDNAEYWVGDVEQFAQLLEAGADGVRSADPDAQIILGGIAWETIFIEQLLCDHDAEDHVDVVNVHAYFETWSPDPVEALPALINRVHDFIVQHGDGETIWLAEVGYSSYRAGASVSPAYSARYAYEHTPEHQANVLLRTIALAMATGKVELLAWYRMNDLPQEQDIIGDVNNRHLGLFTHRGEPKPAERAFAMATRSLGSAVRCSDEEWNVQVPAVSEARVHVFELADGRFTLIGWLPTMLLGSRDTEDDGMADDPGEELIGVELPSGLRRTQAWNAVGTLSSLVKVTRVSGVSNLMIGLRGNQTIIAKMSR